MGYAQIFLSLSCLPACSLFALLGVRAEGKPQASSLSFFLSGLGQRESSLSRSLSLEPACCTVLGDEKLAFSFVLCLHDILVPVLELCTRPQHQGATETGLIRGTWGTCSALAGTRKG